MEGEFHRRLVGPYNGTIRFDAAHIVTGQSPLVDAGWGDPNIAVIIKDREVAP